MDEALFLTLTTTPWARNGPRLHPCFPRRGLGLWEVAEWSGDASRPCSAPRAQHLPGTRPSRHQVGRPRLGRPQPLPPPGGLACRTLANAVHEGMLKKRINL